MLWLRKLFSLNLSYDVIDKTVCGGGGEPCHNCYKNVEVGYIGQDESVFCSKWCYIKYRLKLV